MEDQDQADMKMRLAKLKQEHSDFSAAIEAMITCNCSTLQIQRMKKKKLLLKDEITKLEDNVTPNIIA